MAVISPKFVVFRNFLDKSVRDAILKFVLENETRFRPAEIYEDKSKKISLDRRRGNKISGKGVGVLDPFRAKVLDELPSLFAGTGMEFEAVEFLETEIASYNHGGFFSKHIDTLTSELMSEQGANRVRTLSLVYYFFNTPKVFSGGSLRIWGFPFGGKDVHFDIEPDDNMLVAFPSFVPHEVLPLACSSGDFANSRFAVNCWVHCRI